MEIFSITELNKNFENKSRERKTRAFEKVTV